MRDIFQLLREKELEIIRVREEIDALRCIIPLLEEDGDRSSAPERYPFQAVNQE